MSADCMLKTNTPGDARSAHERARTHTEQQYWGYLISLRSARLSVTGMLRTLGCM